MFKPNVEHKEERRMKAITCSWYGSVNVLKETEVAKPVLKDGELLIKIKSFSVNPVDWKIRRGKVIAKTGLRPPKILGSDFSGVVDKIAAHVSTYQVGDKVWGKVDSFKGGAYAQYIKVKPNNISKMPDNLNFKQAAAIPNVALTAYQALVNKAQIKSGDKVLVNGASGGVGILALQLAKAFGCEVTAVCSKNNIPLVKQLGADHVLDYNKDNILAKRSYYHIFFDCVSTYSLLKVKSCLEAKGVYVRTTPSLETALYGPISEELGFKKAEHIMVMPNHLNLMILKELVENHQLKAIIHKEFSVEQVAEAQLLSEAGRVVGKLVLSWD